MYKFTSEKLLETSRTNCIELLKSGQDSDTILETYDGLIAKAHKSILMSHSDYFRDLIMTPGSDSSLCSCKTVDDCTFIQLPSGISKEHIDMILMYIYSGVIEIPEDKIKKTFLLATFFELYHLRTQCATLLEQIITTENCFELFRFSDEYALDNLKFTTMRYFCANLEGFDEEFLFDLTEDEMIYFLRRPNFFSAVLNQELLLSKLLKWTRIDSKKREKYVERFLEIVNFKTFSKDFILNILAKLQNKKHFLLAKLKTNFSRYDTLNYLPIVFEKSKKIAMVTNWGIELLDIDRKQWQNYYLFKTELNLKYYSTCELDNNIYFSGGCSQELYRPMAKFNCFNVENCSMHILPRMVRTRTAHRMIGLNGKIYACGDSGTPSSTEVYDFVNYYWSTVSSFQYTKKSFGLTTFENSIYAIGGRLDDDSRRLSNSIERFDPREGYWNNIGNVPNIFQLCKSVTLNAKIYCVTPLGKGMIYDIKNRSWEETLIDNLNYKPTYWQQYDIIEYGGEIYGAWKVCESLMSKIHKLDPIVNEWRSVNVNKPDSLPLVNCSTINLNCIVV